MPSPDPLPTEAQLLDAFHGEVAARFRKADSHDGSIYDHFAGPGALVFRRLAERDREEFRSSYFETAEGDRLDEYCFRHGFPDRVLDTRGAGTVWLARENADAGAGTFLAGTRIAFGTGHGETIRYALIRGDQLVSATSLEEQAVLVEAAVPGQAGELRGNVSDFDFARIADPLWDSTWRVLSVDIGRGTLRERDADYRARVRRERLDRRPGYEAAIERALIAAGASVVVFFASDFLGAFFDRGLNRIFVGDSNFRTTDELLLACRLALPSVAVAGTSVQVLPMEPAALTIEATVRLWTQPDRLAADSARRNAVKAIIGYFRGREDPFTWRNDAVRGAIQSAVRGVHAVDIVTRQGLNPILEPDFSTLFATIPLRRWSVSEQDVTVRVSGP